MTNGSLTEMQTIASMPWALNTGASSLKRGRCVDEHVGVNAPGSENTTTFLLREDVVGGDGRPFAVAANAECDVGDFLAFA